ncbi:MAG TPA: hypothetical protein PL143_07320 [Rhodocyclaceae bacterium]|nr:hypothetical protein [Rhodocyclaceae bacterium]
MIVPPPTPAEPVSVFVLDHGYHASLVLPLEAGGAVRYSYGDWDYYALGRTGPRSGLRALLRRTPAALARQWIAGPLEHAAIRRQVSVAVVSMHEVRVEAAAAWRLGGELDEVFAHAAPTQHYDGVYDMYFVRHPTPYTLAHNSNHMVKRWLERLGCKVAGAAVLSAWRLEARTDAAAELDL